MPSNISKMFVDAIDILVSPKEYIVYRYVQNDPVYGALCTTECVTGRELKNYIARHSNDKMRIFRIDDEIKYNIDVTIEEVNNGNNKES